MLLLDFRIRHSFKTSNFVVDSSFAVLRGGFHDFSLGLEVLSNIRYNGTNFVLSALLMVLNSVSFLFRRCAKMLIKTDNQPFARFSLVRRLSSLTIALYYNICENVAPEHRIFLYESYYHCPLESWNPLPNP